jgi:hypothetical protein
VGAFGGNSGLLAFTRRRTKFKTNFIGDIVWDLDNISDALY